MITEFIKDHKRLCAIVFILIVIIIVLVIVNNNSQETEEQASPTSTDEAYMDDMLYTEEGAGTQELDETQSTRYPDINYGVE